MAYTKRTRRTGRKVGYKRRSRTSTRRGGAFGLYRGTKNVAMVRSVARMYNPSRTLNPFPNSKLVRHKYVSEFTLANPGAPAIPATYQFLANSIFDPDNTGIGHQPMFHDEMAAQYKYYTVITSKIKISVAGTNSQELNYLLWVDDDSNFPTDANTAMEQHGSSNSLQRVDRRSSTLHLRASYNGPRWEKTSRTAFLADDIKKTPRNASPVVADRKWFQFYVAPLSSTVTVNTMVCKFEMYFYVLWREPVDHVGS